MSQERRRSALGRVLRVSALAALGGCSLMGTDGPPAPSEADADDMGDVMDLAAADQSVAGDLPAPPDLAPPPDLTVLPVVMVRVPGGTFQMGTPAGTGSDSEHPMHTQTVATFYLDRTEVTVGAYEICVQTQGCTLPATVGGCNWGQPGKTFHPQNCVSWDQATAYCEKQGKRLPSEIEWEYAARGTSGSTYPWGAEAPAAQLCWSGITGRSRTCPVDSYPRTLLGKPDADGLADLAGSLWEWVQDWNCEYPLSGVSGGVNCSTRDKVLRGGCYGHSNPDFVRGAVRDNHRPGNQGDLLGFRCAK